MFALIVLLLNRETELDRPDYIIRVCVYQCHNIGIVVIMKYNVVIYEKYMNFKSIYVTYASQILI
jgi:hypothetical protein